MGGTRSPGLERSARRRSFSQPWTSLRDRGARRAARPRGRPRFRDRVQRPLGERRERTHLLDLVPEQLHAQRLATGRREDVDDPSPDRELATLLDPVDALVTGVRERRASPSRPGSAPTASRTGRGLASREACPRRAPPPTRRRAPRRRERPERARARRRGAAAARGPMRARRRGSEATRPDRRRETRTPPRPRLVRLRPRGGRPAALARAPRAASRGREAARAPTRVRGRAATFVNAWKRSLAASSAMKA